MFRLYCHSKTCRGIAIRYYDGLFTSKTYSNICCKLSNSDNYFKNLKRCKFFETGRLYLSSDSPQGAAKHDSSADSTPEQRKKLKLGYRLQLKHAVKDYGITVIVFHVAISLTSLGICYLCVSNGLDVSRLMARVGFSQDVISSTIITGGSTMVISYAVHKLFAPVRIITTLTAAPFIVKYLRRIGLLKLKTTQKV